MRVAPARRTGALREDVGTANFQGYQATALGVSARVTQNLKVKMGAGYSTSGGATWGGGMSYQW